MTSRLQTLGIFLFQECVRALCRIAVSENLLLDVTDRVSGSRSSWRVGIIVKNLPVVFQSLLGLAQVEIQQLAQSKGLPPGSTVGFLQTREELIVA
jgi:hypothetical protein